MSVLRIGVDVTLGKYKNLLHNLTSIVSVHHINFTLICYAKMIFVTEILVDLLCCVNKQLDLVLTLSVSIASGKQ